MKRVTAKVQASEERVGNYFSDPKPKLEFIPSGCSILDCVLGGGWPLGRIANIVGDKSTGKTLLAIEACANFAYKYPKGQIFYREVESAFDRDYAAALGLPVKRVDFGKIQLETAEDLFDDIKDSIAVLNKHNKPGLYIIDSLDAISDRAEQKRKVDEGSFALEKQKLMGRLFRTHVRKIEASRMCVVVISQVRDKIGAMFGEKHTRTGGRALDFYASQSLWLNHMKTLTRTSRGVKRATGVRIRAKCKKNKIGLPFRECEFAIRFGYGVDDLEASVEFLHSVGKLKELTKLSADSFVDSVEELSDDAEYNHEVKRIGDFAAVVWRDVDRSFMPKRKKYL